MKNLEGSVADLSCAAWLRAHHPDAAMLSCEEPCSIERLGQLLPRAPRPFVEQTATITADMRALGGYEVFIEERGGIPSRPKNWHDFYNAWCWNLFPLTKEALHQSQLQHPAEATAKNGRSSQQNGATLFDENGVIVVTQAEWVLEALRQHRWAELFVDRRQEVLQVARLWFIGHALWEQLRAPFLGLTAKWLAVDLPADSARGSVDAAAAELPPVVPRDLGNLPILGWPGICSANASADFYKNTDYFRPKRR